MHAAHGNATAAVAYLATDSDIHDLAARLRDLCGPGGAASDYQVVFGDSDMPGYGIVVKQAGQRCLRIHDAGTGSGPLVPPSAAAATADAMNRRNGPSFRHDHAVDLGPAMDRQVLQLLFSVLAATGACLMAVEPEAPASQRVRPVRLRRPPADER